MHNNGLHRLFLPVAVAALVLFFNPHVLTGTREDEIHPNPPLGKGGGGHFRVESLAPGSLSGPPAMEWQFASRAAEFLPDDKKQTGESKAGDADSAAESKPEVKAASGELTIRPGDPIWVTATIENPTKDAVKTIRPDCFNTVFTLRSKGWLLLPSCRFRAPYDIPDDVVTLQAKDKDMKQGGLFKVTCNLGGNMAPMFPPDSLFPGRTYTIKATYHNTIEDPDLNDGKCTARDNNCYRLFTEEIRAGLSINTIRVEGEPVTPVPAKVTFKPDHWSLGWTRKCGQRVVARITGMDSRKVEPKTVLLNGTVRPIAHGVRRTGRESGALELTFDGWEALQSVGTPVTGSFYVTVQGELAGTYFTATHRITIKDSKRAP
jgi:hypothetical protein